MVIPIPYFPFSETPLIEKPRDDLLSTGKRLTNGDLSLPKESIELGFGFKEDGQKLYQICWFLTSNSP